jgi:hypothetical protein
VRFDGLGRTVGKNDRTAAGTSTAGPPDLADLPAMRTLRLPPDRSAVGTALAGGPYRDPIGINPRCGRCQAPP